jgi:HEAT repeats
MHWRQCRRVCRRVSEPRRCDSAAYYPPRRHKDFGVGGWQNREIRRVDSSAAEVLARELITKVQDPKQPIKIRRASAYALGRLSQSLPNAWEASGQTVASQSVGALASVLRQGTQIQFPEGYDRLLSAEYLGMLYATTDALGRFGSQAQSALSDICDLLQESVDRDYPRKAGTKDQAERVLDLQVLMAATLGRIPSDPKDARPGKALLKLLDRSDTAPVQAAIYALANLGARPSIQDGAPQIIKQLDSPDEEIRRVAAYCLGRIQPAKYHAEALHKLQQTLADSSSRVKEAAAEAINEFDPRFSFEMLPTLVAAISNEQDTNVRTVLATTIGAIAQREPAIVEPRQRKDAIQSLSDADDVMKHRRDSLEKLDASYGPVLNAIDQIEQSESSLRGTRLRSLVRSHPKSAIFITLYCAWCAICLAILRMRPLKLLTWNKALRNIVDLSIPLPFGLGRQKLPIRYALFVGVLNYHSRVLDAWIEKHAENAKRSLRQRQTVQERSIYVPLPVFLTKEESKRVFSLKASDLRDTCDEGRWCIRILGEGGSGKTSLACQIAFWCLAEDPDQRICKRHRAIPVLLESGNMLVLESGTATFHDVICSQLQAEVRLPDPIDPGCLKCWSRHGASLS